MNNRTFENTQINESVTIVVSAAEELKGMNCKAVTLTADGAKLPAAGDAPVGIVLISQEEDYKKGDEVSLQVKDIGFWLAGATVSAGDLLAVDAEGMCQKATSGQYAYARALGAATDKGDIVTVQIINAGVQA